MPKISKDIENDSVDVARVLKPHLETQPVTDVKTGEKREQKRRAMNVVMDGTSQTFEFPAQYGFSDPDSVHVTLSPKSTVNMWGDMVSGNKVTITAASSLTAIKIKILMRGY